MLNFFFFSIRAAELALGSVMIAMRIRPNRLCHAFAFPWTPGRKNYEPLATFLLSISDVIMWTHLRLSIKKSAANSSGGRKGPHWLSLPTE